MIGGFGTTMLDAWDNVEVVLLLEKWQHLRLVLPYSSKDFPVAQTVKNLLAMQKTRVRSVG